MGFTNVKSQSPGKAASDSKKSDMKLPQHGGEGGGLDKKSGSFAFTPKKGYTEEYCGPGRHLDTKSF